jgi:type IV fimbrial biogenesis protein FimT
VLNVVALRSARRRPAGFTLVELLVTLALLALLLAAAVPGFGAWMANASVRTTAEELQNALRLAQAEAVRRNRQVALVLTNAPPALFAAPAANGQNWYVRALPIVANEAVDDRFFVTGGTFASARQVAITAPALICFNSLGRLAVNNATGLGANCVLPAGGGQFDITIAHAGANRNLRVQVFAGGRLRLCDPDPAKVLPAAPDACQ